MNLPEGFELEKPLKLQNQIKLPEGFELEKPLAKQEPEAAPIQLEQPESFSTLRHVADIPLKTTQGLISGVKMISDAFGANNPISKNLDSAGNYIADLMSAQAKNDSAKVQEIIKEAQDKGVYDQLVSGIIQENQVVFE